MLEIYKEVKVKVGDKQEVKTKKLYVQKFNLPAYEIDGWKIVKDVPKTETKEVKSK